jgi:hypothetical protein
MIADLRECHVRANLLDNPGRLMTHYNREIAGPLSANQVHIAVTDRGRGQANFDLALLRRIDLNFLDYKRLAKCVADSGLHRKLLTCLDI